MVGAVVFALLSQPALHVTEKQVREQKPAYTILVKYPEISGAADFNSAVLKIVAPIIDRFKNGLQKAPSANGPAAQAYLNGFYTTTALKSGIVSVLFKWDEYNPPAAHPAGGMASINYDGRTGRVLQLSDLFQPGTDYVSRLSQLAIDSLKRRPNANEALIREGAGPVEDNFKVFTLSGTALVLHFHTYQVGTRVDGPQQVEIPLDTIRPLLRK